MRAWWRKVEAVKSLSVFWCPSAQAVKGSAFAVRQGRNGERANAYTSPLRNLVPLSRGRPSAVGKAKEILDRTAEPWEPFLAEDLVVSPQEPARAFRPVNMDNGGKGVHDPQQ